MEGGRFIESTGCVEIGTGNMKEVVFRSIISGEIAVREAAEQRESLLLAQNSTQRENQTQKLLSR